MPEATRSLGLAPAPLERVGADLVIAPLFDAEHPLRGAAGRIDWRLCGRLSHLCASGRSLGTAGSAVLIPGGGGLRAPRVLGLGLGSRCELDAARWQTWIVDALARARELRARVVVAALPESGDRVGERLAVLASAIAADEATPEVLVAPEPPDCAAVADWLRSAARRGRPEGLEVRPPTEVRSPHGVVTPSPRSESSHRSAGRFTR